MRGRSSRYICTIEYGDNINIQPLIKSLKETYGSIHLRGRHSDRKGLYKRMGWGYGRHSQNDVPWRLAERIDIYKRK
jgi:hypothetical protein